MSKEISPDTGKYYENCSGEYDAIRDSSAYQKLTTKWEHEFIGGRLHGGAALEIGCGTGRITEALFQKGLDVTVADQAAGMIERLREKFPDEKFGSVCGDIFTLGKLLGAEGFDTIVSMRVIPHIRDMAGALEVVRGLLKPGGNFIFDMWNSWSYLYLRRRVVDVLFSRKEEVYTRFLPLPEIFSLVRGAGFEVKDWAGWGFPQAPGYPLEVLRRTPLRAAGKTIMLNCVKPFAG